MTESFALLYCNCVACHKPIAVNPNYCPSLRINGERKPLCMSCFDKWNVIHRLNKGLVPLPLHRKAYAPCPADEVNL